MTDSINGTPILPAAAPEPVTPGIAIAMVQITLGSDHQGFEVRLREPGIIRAVGFWLKQPAVIAASIRGIDPVPMPMLFVEANPALELRSRRFLFVPSDAIITKLPAGTEARWAGTAMSGARVAHLFELVQVPS